MGKKRNVAQTNLIYRSNVWKFNKLCFARTRRVLFFIDGNYVRRRQLHRYIRTCAASIVNNACIFTPEKPPYRSYFMSLDNGDDGRAYE